MPANLQANKISKLFLLVNLLNFIFIFINISIILNIKVKVSWIPAFSATISNLLDLNYINK